MSGDRGRFQLSKAPGMKSNGQLVPEIWRFSRNVRRRRMPLGPPRISENASVRFSLLGVVRWLKTRGADVTKIAISRQRLVRLASSRAHFKDETFLYQRTYLTTLSRGSVTRHKSKTPRKLAKIRDRQMLKPLSREREVAEPPARGRWTAGGRGHPGKL